MVTTALVSPDGVREATNSWENVYGQCAWQGRETPSCYIILSHINPSSSLLMLLFYTLPAANLLSLPLSLSASLLYAS